MSASSGLLRQVALLPAGGQPWFKNVLACKGRRFAYAATLAVYVYQYSKDVSQFVLDSVISVSTKTITGIAWHPKNDDLLAVASRDPMILVWSVSNHCAVASTCMVQVRPLVIAWHQDDYDAIIYCDEKGPLYLWKNVSTKGTSLRSSDGLIRREQQQWKSVQWKEIAPFNSAVTHARWHPTVPGKLAFGHANGTISLYIKDRKAERHFAVVPEGYWEAFQESCKDDKSNQSISAMEWDPQSQSYILVILGGRCMFLLDTALENSVVVQRYSPPSKAVSLQTVAWIPGAPGVFVTGDCDTGVLRVWSVSQESPLESIRLKQTGFQALCTLPKCGSTEDDSQSYANTKAMIAKNVSYKKFASPTGKLVALFIDGGSGVYDLSLRKWDFKQEMGHVETIFDCQFKGESVDLLATTSYDGTMKIWDITTMTPVTSSPGDETVIYSLSWAPGDIDCIAAATSKRGVVIWDIAKGLISKRFTSHGKSACVYCVAWNQKDARKIASGGTDSQCLVHQADGKLMHTLRHPATVYGCDWHPSNEAILATACEDKAIRIFSVTTGNVEPIKTLQGHTGKVFKVRWSPLRESLLCSTSDDHTVRVWDYSSDSCQRTLIGHSDCVRGACWSPEIPHILITGSWDSTIRIWDTRDGTCLDTIHDHGADVYGLACHPRRPFLLASSSRDSTLRLWSLQPLAATLHAKCLLNQPMEQVFAFHVDGATSDNPESPLKLCGKASLKIYQSLKSIGEDDWEKEAPLIISPFFCYSKSIDNFLDLISVLQGKDLSRLSPGYAKAQVIHYKHLARFQTSRAQQMELVKMTRFGSGGVGAPSKEASLEQAAEIYLLLGNLQKYCELKMELGEWLLALSVAPAVSLDFWKKSTAKYANLVRNSSTLLQAAPHLAATRSQKDLVNLLANHGMWQKALTVAAEMKKIQEEFPQPPLAVEEDPSSDALEETIEDTREVPYENGPRLNLLNECVENLSEFHLHQGAPVTAASYHLSIDDVSSAMNTLVRGHEMELAIALGQALNFKESAYQCALYCIAFKCFQRGEWDLASDVIKMCTVNDTAKIQLSASCPLTLVERNKLQEKLGLPDVQASFAVAEETLAACQVGQDDEIILKEKSISHYLISNRPVEGLKLGLDTIRDCLSKGSWKMSNLWSIIQKVAYVKASILAEDSNSRLCNELQLYTSYLGALAAIYHKYNPIVKPLYNQTSFFLAKLGNIALPITFEQLTSEIHAWEITNVSKTTCNGEQEQTYREIQSHLEGWNSPFVTGEVIVTGGHLPRHSDQHRCIISGKSIKGPIFVLDDGKSAMSLSNAIMWARVNPFSPLGTGLRINPF